MAGEIPKAAELQEGFFLGDWRVFPDENRIVGNPAGKAHLEPKLMDLLVCLARQPGRVVSHDELFQQLWPGAYVADVALKRNVSALRRALRDDASHPRYIRTIRKRGYQLIETVVPVERSHSAAESQTEADTTRPPIRSVAVLPLEDVSGESEQAFFADGMTDVLISNLARIRALKVISRTSTMRYKGRSKSIPVAARELGVDAVVEGSVLRAGERVRVIARLVDAAHDQLLWAETYEHPLGDVLKLQSEIAREIVSKIRLELTPQEDAQLARAGGRIDPAVHEAYLKGRYFWHKRTTDAVKHGLACFEEAVRLNPSFAPAYAGIADSHIVDGGRYLGVPPNAAYGRAREAATRAIELDDSLAEAHTSLAAVLTDYDWDWAGADREYRCALELNPNYATAHSWYAEHLSRMGRHDEAIDLARGALELDPVSIFSSMLVAWILYFARRYEEAVEQAQATLDLDPDYATALRIEGWAFEETGRHDEAITAHRRACALTHDPPNFVASLGRAYAMAGRAKDAREVLAGLRNPKAGTYVSALDVAIIHTALGDHERAFKWLDRAFEEHSDHLPYLAVNPRLDPLRNDPRLDGLLQRMGLPATG